MGMESFGNEPTKESTQWALDNSRKALERNEERLKQAEDTPISNIFSEGAKNMAIKNFQNSINIAKEEIEKYEKDLETL